MRALLALAVTLAVVIVAEPAVTATATAPSPSSPPPSFAPVVLPMTGTRAPEAARLPAESSAASQAVGAILDPGVAPIPTPPARRQPTVRPKVVVKRVGPVRFTGRTSHQLRGAASWYCNRDGSRGAVSACHSAYPDTGGFDAYAAAGPRLRAAIGGSWRGRVVSVDGLRVKLVDWCQCYQGQSNEKVIDLYRDVYGFAGGSVTIRW